MGVLKQQLDEAEREYARFASEERDYQPPPWLDQRQIDQERATLRQWRRYWSSEINNRYAAWCASDEYDECCSEAETNSGE
jgi:hypothetical protein